MWELSENDSMLPVRFRERLYLQLNWLSAFLPFFYILTAVVFIKTAGFPVTASLFMVFAEWGMLRLLYYLTVRKQKITADSFAVLDSGVRAAAGLPGTILLLQNPVLHPAGLLRLGFGIFFVHHFGGFYRAVFFLSLTAAGLVFYPWFVSGFRLFTVDFFYTAVITSLGILFFLFLEYGSQLKKKTDPGSRGNIP